MEESLMEIFLREKMTPQEAQQQNPLVLAFLGDGVFELFVRTKLMAQPQKVNQMHRMAAKIVCAKGQSDLAVALSPYFTKEEEGVFRRGRNTNQKTMAKNATVHDYRNATGFEALMGYLYISNQKERLAWYFQEIERILDDESKITK
ncbi:Mini-ribonuclease 3 [Peptoniphilus sp. KCTC 25270]|uniref:Mini-ribonuclease 3 n=1 Tax=Peptoniphilus sp. KCTC 25270 TaxID=2897414 RepID=UPI001E4138FF|nr:ribonuclease III domain-containing protein [Peptoniphilus sp. KCTC 25270]MCD1147608.1 Mini-ribonuclease 3 [Peptoniphilus sp. KCTC 25270]